MKWEGSHNKQETGTVQSGTYLRKNVCKARFLLNKDIEIKDKGIGGREKGKPVISRGKGYYRLR